MKLVILVEPFNRREMVSSICWIPVVLFSVQSKNCKTPGWGLCKLLFIVVYNKQVIYLTPGLLEEWTSVAIGHMVVFVLSGREYNQGISKQSKCVVTVTLCHLCSCIRLSSTVISNYFEGFAFLMIYRWFSLRSHWNEAWQASLVKYLRGLVCNYY